MKKTAWFDRKFTFGFGAGMLPFFLERLNGSMARLREKTDGVPEDVLSNMLDGKWSIKQNIGHLAEVDEIANQRIAQIVAGISPMVPAVVQPGRDYNAMPIHEVLEYFVMNRIKNLDNFTHIHEDDLAKTSIHPRLNVAMSPVDIAYFDAEHDDHHIVRINEILSVLNP
jgi:hypothetical protein